MSGPVVLALRLLLAVCLYAFLGWAFVSLWRDIKQQGALLASRKVPPISLTIARGESASQVRHFVQPEVIIGRDPACECPVDDESISARHARLSFHHNQWWLEDLDFTNGTLLNQEKLAMPTVVITDDEFRCGETRFIISLAGDILMPPTRRN
jgi:pSer/pThr/pTyr-binding forkhead associated (FHA) protein